MESCTKAWNCGRGQWALANPKVRIQAVEDFAKQLTTKVDQIAEILCWEICKPHAEAKKEIDRTIKYIFDTIKAVKDLENRESTFQFDEGVMAQIRRAPYGTVLCSGPFNCKCLCLFKMKRKKQKNKIKINKIKIINKKTNKQSK